MQKLGDVADGVDGTLIVHAFGAEDCDGAVTGDLCRGGDEDEAGHAGVLLLEIEDDADGLLGGVDVGVEELDEALFFFECGEHGAEAVAVGWKAEEVDDAVDVDGLLLDCVGRDGAGPKVDCVGELLVDGALVVDAAGEFVADAVDVPAAEVLVEEVGGGL